MSAGVVEVPAADGGHLELSSRTGFGTSYAAGEWWTNGVVALRLFEKPMVPTSLELMCGCSDWYATADGKPKERIPSCCTKDIARDGEFKGEWVGYCTARSPSDCTHLAKMWGSESEVAPRWTRKLEALFDLPRHPATVETAIVARPRFDRCRRLVDHWRQPIPRFAFFDADLLALIEQEVHPDRWEWTGYRYRYSHINDGKVVKAPIAIALRDAVPVAAVTSLCGDGVAWYRDGVDGVVPA